MVRELKITLALFAGVLLVALALGAMGLNQKALAKPLDQSGGHLIECWASGPYEHFEVYTWLVEGGFRTERYALDECSSCSYLSATIPYYDDIDFRFGCYISYPVGYSFFYNTSGVDDFDYNYGSNDGVYKWRALGNYKSSWQDGYSAWASLGIDGASLLTPTPTPTPTITPTPTSTSTPTPTQTPTPQPTPHIQTGDDPPQEEPYAPAEFSNLSVPDFPDLICPTFPDINLTPISITPPVFPAINLTPFSATAPVFPSVALTPFSSTFQPLSRVNLTPFTAAPPTFIEYDPPSVAPAPQIPISFSFSPISLSIPSFPTVSLQTFPTVTVIPTPTYVLTGVQFPTVSLDPFTSTGMVFPTVTLWTTPSWYISDTSYSTYTFDFISNTITPIVSRSKSLRSNVESDVGDVETLELFDHTAESLAADMVSSMDTAFSYVRAFQDIGVLGPTIVSIMGGLVWIVIITFAKLVLKSISTIIDLAILVIKIGAGAA